MRNWRIIFEKRRNRVVEDQRAKLGDGTSRSESWADMKIRKLLDAGRLLNDVSDGENVSFPDIFPLG